MTPHELQQLLREFYLERLALLMQHEAVGAHVTDYDVNNAYQYIINREETHISWLQHALLDLGAPMPPRPGASPTSAGAQGEDAAPRMRKTRAPTSSSWTSGGDASKPSRNARHQGMLRVILGEMLEHERLFEQAAAGRDGHHRHAAGDHEPRRVGVVMRDRWSWIAAAPVPRRDRPRQQPGRSRRASRVRRSPLCRLLADLRVSTFNDTDPVGVRSSPAS